MKTAATLALLLLLTACADAEGEAPTAAPTTVADSPTPEDIVADPEAKLVSVKVRRAPTGLHIAAWWRVGSGDVETGAGGAIVESSDGFETAHYRPWTRGWYVGHPEPLAIPGLQGLMQARLVSLAPGIRAVSGGGDGATLFPFEAMARSTDGGATWTTHDVAKVEGQRAYSSGEVVLADGRVLALLANWSDDRRDQPNGRHHGLFVSEGDDWSRYSPVTPTFRPEPRPALHGWPNTQSLEASPDHGGVIWVTTVDQRVYASTDGAQTFHEIRIR